MVRPGLTLLCLAALVRAQEARLDWETGPHESYESVKVELLPDPPDGLRPVTEPAHYGQAALAGGLTLSLASDHTRLWIDKDFDGRLDEQAVAFNRVGTRLDATVDLLVPFARDRPPERIRFYVYRPARRGYRWLHFAALAHRGGTVVLEGRERRLALHDDNGDLRFDDPDHDSLHVDLDGDGQLDRGPDSAERVRPGRPFHLRGRGYVARVAGVSVRFEPSPNTPPPPRRPWRAEAVPAAGRAAHPPQRPWRELKRDYAALRTKEKRSGHLLTYRRRTVLAAIGNLGTKEAFAFLHRVARTAEDPEVRAAAARATGYTAYAGFADKVAGLARSAPSAQVRVAAIEALHYMDAPGRGEVLAIILRQDTQDEVIASAARHLAYTQRAAAFRALDDAITELRAPALRYHAYYAATRFRPFAPPDALVLAAAQERDPRLQALGLRDAFALGLRETRDLALIAATSKPVSVQLQLGVVEILGALGDPAAVRALLPLAEYCSATVRGRLVDLLAPVRDPGAVGVLLAGLDAEHPGTRAVVADILAEIPGPHVTVGLAARLARERDERTLMALMRAAGRQRADLAASSIVAAARRVPENGDLQRAALRALSRMGLARPTVSAFFRERAGTRDRPMQVFVLDLLAESDDPAAAAILAEHVGAEAWQARLAAVQGLGVVRVKSSIPLLIDRLEREENLRIRRAIAESLFRLTGENLFDIVDLWRKWWGERAKTFAVPEEVPRRPDRPGSGRSVATFYGVPVESDRIIFVIDQSGSMGSMGAGFRGGPQDAGATRLERAVEETLKVVGKLAPDSRINVILFESGVHRWRKALTKLTKRNRAALSTFLRARRPLGGTNLFDGLEQALMTEGVDTVYLLSDGHPSGGRFVAEEDIVREIREINRTRRIALHCVAIGHDSSLLRRLAAQNAGSYARR